MIINIKQCSHPIVKVAGFGDYIVRYGGLFIKSSNGALGAKKLFLQMHRTVRTVQMIAL